MEMQTNLAGRLRNTPLPLTSGLLPLYEAVVNSIHSIEEAELGMDKGEITITIHRKQKQQQLEIERKRGPDALEDIVGFSIVDNGIGFTNANMASFQTLDSERKAAKGCRGIGRLLWLKAFESVNVDSVFIDKDSSPKRRSFRFDANYGVSKEKIVDETIAKRRTTSVSLEGFGKRYREYARKTPHAIVDSIIEHCLWYFIRPGSAPLITLVDSDDKISLNRVFDGRMHSSAVRESIEIKGQNFDLIHVKLRSSSIATHAIAFCADDRLVTEEKIAGKIPGLHGKFSDEEGEFVYSCYVNSPYLDEWVRPERTGFDIAESTEGLMEPTEISLNDIRNSVVEQTKKHLSQYISEIIKKAKARVVEFVANKAPRYRPILNRIPDERLNIDPEISDKELDLVLHKFLAEIEAELLREGHCIMVPQGNETSKDYQSRLAAYLGKAEDIKKSDLANYVFHRKVILDLLQRAIARKPDGTYEREDLIHSLIMPMRKESTDVFLDGCNLWLVDERLAFHDYLASDKSIASMPITGADDLKEPDICGLSIFDNPVLFSEAKTLPLASIVIVEIKRPMRNDAKPGETDDPVEQAIGYLNRVRKGQVQTSNGRPIPESETIPGFCYVIADITTKLRDRCLVHHDLKYTSDKMGFFGYKQNCNAYVEVVSFDRLVEAAKQRNKAFFDKLGLPTN